MKVIIKVEINHKATTGNDLITDEVLRDLPQKALKLYYQ